MIDLFEYFTKILCELPRVKIKFKTIKSFELQGVHLKNNNNNQKFLIAGEVHC